MAPRYRNGEHVRYKPVGGPDSNTPDSTGKITDVLTEPGVQADRNVQASASDPRYEIVNDNTGKATTVYESNILGKATGR
ncbi:Uu.00g026600.m01.CDS01 [Anthostomella pinea]|uniref:Uu.00g026600.m01.CDS01 n=1 Tax=Anthostomella pinea TaxID=933095 RepID=A0AAI8V828_9PEZI|nr:Uu.00g026600.m01.CDS01 [Anthostomella pinea]